MNVTQAYGRRMMTADMVRADWTDGLDFRIDEPGHKYNGAYVNKYDPCEEEVTVTLPNGIKVRLKGARP